MHTLDPHLVHARTLRADMLAAPNVWLPRREVLLEWLSAFLQRAAAPKYVLEPSDASDLDALEQYLRGNNVPATGSP